MVPTSTSATPALEVRGLTRTYGDGASAVTALGGVDVAFTRGSLGMNQHR